MVTNSFFIRWVVLLFILSLLISCGGGTTTTTSSDNSNSAPVAPVINMFTATPSDVVNGQPTNVTWSWTYSNTPTPTPTCSINQGVGALTSGSVKSVTLNANTDFTLTCSNSVGNDTAQTTITTVGNEFMTPSQKAVAEALTSVWENDTPELDYAYSENIHDGRGYTSGRAGFCTGTGDAIQVIDCYDGLRSAANGNLMAKYMPALITISNNYESTGKNQGDTSLLDAVGNWVVDWEASYNTPLTQGDFKSCQDHVSDELYYTPAMLAAAGLNLQTALTRAALYDMWINQGDDELVRQTNAALNLVGQVGNGVTESQWLQKFLELRRDMLANDATWKESVDRVAAYEKARRRANWDLEQAVDSAVKAAECWPAGTYADSGYTVYIIQPDAIWTKSTLTSSCQ